MRLRERGTLASIDEACAGGHVRVDLGRGGGRWREHVAHDGGPRAVDRRHVRVVGGEGEQARELLAYERRLVRGTQGGVRGAFPPDRRGPFLLGWAARAEAAGAVGREQEGAVGHRGEPAHRRVLRARERLGSLGAEQVGPARAADDEAPAREHRDRLLRAGRVDGVRGVLGRVPRRRERHQPQVADPHLRALVHGHEGEGVAGACRPRDLGPGGRSHLGGSRDVVVVHVGLEHEAHAHPSGPGGGEEATRIALRIDQDRLVAGREQVAVVAEPRRHDQVQIGREVHLRIVATRHGWADWGRRTLAPPRSRRYKKAAHDTRG